MHYWISEYEKGLHVHFISRELGHLQHQLLSVDCVSHLFEKCSNINVSYHAKLARAICFMCVSKRKREKELKSWLSSTQQGVLEEVLLKRRMLRNIHTETWLWSSSSRTLLYLQHNIVREGNLVKKVVLHTSFCHTKPVFMCLQD